MFKIKLNKNNKKNQAPNHTHEFLQIALTSQLKMNFLISIVIQYNQ